MLKLILSVIIMASAAFPVLAETVWLPEWKILPATAETGRPIEMQKGMQDALYFFDKGADNDLVDKAQSHDKNYKPHIRFDKLPSIKWADEELLCWGD